MQIGNIRNWRLIMLNFVKAIVIFPLLLLVITACYDSVTVNTDYSDEPLVYASFYPMYDFAQKAAGDLAEVRCFIPDGTEPHDWEPSPKDVAALEKADMFVYSSGGFETWTKSVLTAVNTEKLMPVEASTYSAYSDDDPHTWLSPIEARLQFIRICDALRVIDPENSDKYTANEVRWGNEFDKLDAEYSGLRGLSQNKILVTHAAFGNLCHAYGLEQIPVTEGSSDSEPDPARMAEIVAMARENSITTVFYEEISGAKLANAIAGEIGGKAVALSPLEGLTDEQRKNGDDYFSIMRKNLSALQEALT